MRMSAAPEFRRSELRPKSANRRAAAARLSRALHRVSLATLGFALGGSALGCSGLSDPAVEGYISTTVGQETDAWSEDPVPENVLIEMVTDTRTTLSTQPAPLTRFSLGTDGPSGVVASFEATATDADGNAVMRGTSVPFYVQGFAGAAIPLFMGRTGGFSRPSGELTQRRHHPLVASAFHAYLLIGGGDSIDDSPPPAPDVYSMVGFRTGSPLTSLVQTPESWVVAGSKVLILNESSTVWFDLDTRASSPATSSTAYAAVLGGQTISGPNDTQYIVGATRTSGEPSDRVLRVDSDGTIHVLKLTTARRGAAAAIVDGQLVIVGGSDSAPGAEVSTRDGTGFSALRVLADATEGAAMSALDTKTVVLAGGIDPSSGVAHSFRTLHLDCSDECSAEEIPKLEFPYTRPRLFALAENEFLAVGESDSGEMHVFTLEKTIGYTLSEKPLRVPRSNASAALLPNGQIGVIGGDSIDDGSPASGIELFFPSR